MENLYIYGTRAISEAIHSGRTIDKVWLLKESKNPLFEKLLHLVRTHQISCSFVPEERLKRFSQKNHQGAVARMASIQLMVLEELLPTILEKEKNPVFILLDGITDVRNFGALLRTAVATGVAAVIIPDKGSAPINGDVVKTSAGSIFKIPIAKVAHLKDAVYLLKTYDVQVLGITEKANQTIYTQDLRQPTALVLGSEDRGISKGLLKIMDHQTKLPMSDAIASLNVSVAGGVALYEIIRQRNHTA